MQHETELVAVQRPLKIWVVMLAAAVVTACGGGGGGGGDVAPVPVVPAADPTILTGRFFDAQVEGLEYRSATLSGLTDAEGKFIYRAGEAVEFFVGGQSVGTAPGKSLVHVYDVTAPGFAAPTANSSLRIAQVLQSLDLDGDPSNGISILAVAKTWFAKAVLDFTATPNNFAIAFNNAAAPGARTLKPEAQAQTHLDSGNSTVAIAYETACGVSTGVHVLGSLIDRSQTSIDTAQGFFNCEGRAQVLAFKYKLQPGLRDELNMLSAQSTIYGDQVENTQYILDEAKRTSVVGLGLSTINGLIDQLDEFTDIFKEENQKVAAIKGTAALAKAALAAVDVLYKPANARNSQELELGYKLAQVAIDAVSNSTECAVLRKSKKRNDACTQAVIGYFRIVDKSLKFPTLDNELAATALLYLGETLDAVEALADLSNPAKAKSALIGIAVDVIATTAKLGAIAYTSDGSAARELWKGGIDTVATVVSSGLACKSALTTPTISSIKACKDKAIFDGIVDPTIKLAFNTAILWDLGKINAQTQSLLLSDRLLRDYLAVGGDLPRWYARYGLVDQETSHFCWNLLSRCSDDQLTHERAMFDQMLATLKDKGPWGTGLPSDATWQRFNEGRAQLKQLAQYYMGDQVLQVVATANAVERNVAISVVGKPSIIDSVQCMAPGATTEVVNFATGNGGTATLNYTTDIPVSMTCVGRKDGVNVVRRSVSLSLVNCDTSEVLTQGQCSRFISGVRAVKNFAEEFNATLLNPLVWTAMKPRQESSTTVDGTTLYANYFGFLWTKDKVVFSGDKIVVEGRGWGPGSGRGTAFTLYDAETNGDAVSIGDTTYGGWGFHANGSGSFNFLEVERPSGVGPAPQHCTALGGSTSAVMEYRMTLVGNRITFERGPTLANITQSATRTLGRSISGRAFYLVVGAGDIFFSPAYYDWVRVKVD